jgi:hypothetical protein
VAIADIQQVIYTPGLSPQFEASKDIYIQNELKKISEAIQSLNTAIQEIKAHLETP